MLWAPVVDAVYSFSSFVTTRWSKRMGRRKTWIVPLQLLIGIMFISLSSVIEKTLYSESPNIPFLTVCFFIFYLLAATQDIAVDAWALTMLSKKNKGWQSTCNSVGQTLGVHLANSVFLALNEPTFLSSIRGSVGPIVTLRQFCLFWGVVYIMYTLYILFFVEEKEEEVEPVKQMKSEIPNPTEGEPLITRRRSPRPSESKEMDEPKNESDATMSLSQTYKLYFDILKNPYFLRLALILLTNRIGVFPAEAASNLRLIDKGMESVALTSLKMFYFPLEMVITVLVSRILSRVHPLILMQRCYVCRISMAMILACFIHFLPDVDQGMMEKKYYPIAYILIILSSASAQSMNVSAMTYFAQISDPRFGGSYMSLFNTISNLGHNMYVSPFLSLIDVTSKRDGDEVIMKTCVCKDMYLKCKNMGGMCVTSRDGFYLLAWPTFIYGLIWSVAMKGQFAVLRVSVYDSIYIQSVDREKWKVI
ncbi:hypothetical protein JH06_0828 [Blastocystis sp. subtype 4]|uniref:hypothetical protein n=1 Tax=Blastocystis sp. subtype 4 TaxID=944170 RepID=UPI000711A3C9|nr:hypothetical protein JH06_0828 [Blastocystis sp. subtype 4]KNB46323.1 hypothetical protein JH06_0828 [Blastocystis sp. subtype 4]|eukprot:XP_014529764.1 hypothetical protein JH06_0828 [Blastocystis sp. subtype 4]